MIHLDVQHDGDRRVEIKEGIHIFARLEYKVLITAYAVRSAHRGKLGAGGDRRGSAGLHKRQSAY